MTTGEYQLAISYPDPKIPAPTGNEPPGKVLPSREVLQGTIPRLRVGLVLKPLV